MGVLRFLETLRNPVGDEAMLLITRLGEETAFLLLAIIFFWCVDKKRGYFVLFVGFAGILANQFLKLLFRIPRPWILDPAFKPVEAAVPAATGYSFPSGHTQTAVGAFGAIAATEKKRWVRVAAIVLAILVGFSRMYLGVHTPQDVLTSVVLAVIFIFTLRPLVMTQSQNRTHILLIAVTLMCVVYLGFVHLYSFPADIDADNLYHGTESAYTLLGCLAGFLIAYPVEKKWIRFPVEAVWWAQFPKVVVGLILVLAVKSGLKAPLNMLFGEFAGRAVRYFLVVVVAGVVWPLTFRWFNGLGKKRV